MAPTVNDDSSIHGSEDMTSAPSGSGSATAGVAAADRIYARRWLILAVVCLGIFMILLDATIVSIAIPSILTGFSTGFSQVEWVMNSYLLVFAVLLIPAGRFGDLYGRRLVFVVGLCLFTLASLACGAAPGVGWLIGFRALQGLGGSLMMPNTLSIIANVFPAEERGKAMGFWGAVSGVSLALGPSLGGLLVAAASWRWIFFINVPIGILLLGLSLRFIPESKDPTSVKQMDHAGLAVLTLSLFALTFALIEGQNYGWKSGLILGLFAGAVVGLALFVVIERRQLQPLMDLGLFKDRTFTVTNAVGLIMSFGMMGVFFLLPVFLQAILGYGAVKAGLVMTPLAAIVIVASPLSGALSDRIGPRGLMFAGMLIAAGGFFLTRRVMFPGASWPVFVFPFVMSGFGIGMVMPPQTSAVMGTVEPERAGQASGVLSSMRQIGSVLGIAVMGAVLQNRALVYIRDGVRAKLEVAPAVIPEAAKQQIVAAIDSSAVSLGQMRSGGGMAISPPDEVTQMMDGAPDAVAAQVTAFFNDLFSLESVMDAFAQAMRTTYGASVILMVVGGLLAVAVKGRISKKL